MDANEVTATTERTPAMTPLQAHARQTWGQPTGKMCAMCGQPIFTDESTTTKGAPDGAYTVTIHTRCNGHA